MLSIVPFVDTQFRFVGVAPFIKFECCQINHRLYVIDKKTKELCENDAPKILNESSITMHEYFSNIRVKSRDADTLNKIKTM